MMVEPPRPVSVVSVVPLNDLHVQLDFDDGVSRTVDLAPYIQGPNFKQIRLSEKFFRTVHVEGGAIVWDNGVMLDADLLRYGPPKPEKPKAVNPSKASKAKAKPAAKAPAKKVSKAVKPAKKSKPAAKPVKAKPAAKPAKKAAKKKK